MLGSQEKFLEQKVNVKFFTIEKRYTKTEIEPQFTSN